MEVRAVRTVVVRVNAAHLDIMPSLRIQPRQERKVLTCRQSDRLDIRKAVVQ
jgi:hypothetical protein